MVTERNAVALTACLSPKVCAACCDISEMVTGSACDGMILSRDFYMGCEFRFPGTGREEVNLDGTARGIPGICGGNNTVTDSL